MVNRYKGICTFCKQPVAPLAGVILSPKGSHDLRMRVAHTECADYKVPRVIGIRMQQKSFIRNVKGRCEDAPCCGCCTI